VLPDGLALIQCHSWQGGNAFVKKINLNDFKTANHRILRDINEVIVLNIIRERQPIPRVDIAAITGLEEGTISRIVQRFLRSGLVYEEGVGPSTPAGGRKPRYVHLNPTKSCAIGVDIGAIETLVALSDFNGRLQHVRRLPNAADPERSLVAVATEIDSLMRLANPYNKLEGIGISLIGLVDSVEGIILEGENLGWGAFIEVGRILRSRIRDDVPLYFENGARLSALGEIWFGTTPLSGFRDMVFLDINEGVGTGIVVNGQLYRGFRNGAGEFGHICIDPQGPQCSCGSHGCLEVYASDLATIQRYHQKVHPKQQSAPDGRISIDIILEKAAQADPISVETLRETARYLGMGLAPIIYALNPEAIVIGGKIAGAWPMLKDEALRSCAQRVSQLFLETTKIFASTLHVKPSLMGAIALVLAQKFAVPNIV
jgi:predicted NBD/HSP70 family sugar kinase